LIKREIKPFLLSCTFIFYHMLYCAFFIISMLVGIDKKQNQFGKFLERAFSFDIKIDKNWQNPQNFIKIWPKTVLFRNITLISSLEKPCYLENSVVSEPCKRRTACISWEKETNHCNQKQFGIDSDFYIILLSFLLITYNNTIFCFEK